jgi:hypothetical protein
MLPFGRFIPHPLRQIIFALCVATLAVGATPSSTVSHELGHLSTVSMEEAAKDASPPQYKWNVGEKQSPLLDLPEQVKPGIDQSLAFPIAQFSFPIFKTLNYDRTEDKYSLPVITADSSADQVVAFTRQQGSRGVYSANANAIELLDNDNVKVLRTGAGIRYLFIRYPDDELRCAAIKDTQGSYISLNYTANGVLLHGIVDSLGRTVIFNYEKDGIRSITQTWMHDAQGITKTWSIGEASVVHASMHSAITSSAMISKTVPTNALIKEYTPAMAESDRTLAEIFGGPGAVAAANGFEPAGLAASYPFYRGDVVGMDGKLRRGHLSCAMHLYGSADGRAETALYIPAGFTTHSAEPSPTDGVVTFYYPRLGNLADVTLAIFHVADFQISYEGDRARIGNIGGPGGSSPLYKHSHVEFYKGNTGLPSLPARAGLRIDPVTVFRAASDGR